MAIRINPYSGGLSSISNAKIGGQSRSEDPLSNNGLRLSINSEGDSAGDAVSISTQRQSIASSPTLRSQQRFAERAEEASEKISDLRQKQLAYAEEAEELAFGDPQLERLDELAQEAQNELDALSADATYNGQSVLAGGTFLSANYDGSDALVVSISSGSGQVQDLGIDLSTPSTASSAVSLLEEIVPGALIYANSAKSASESSSRNKPAQSEDDLNRSQLDGAKSVEEAKDISRKVAGEIKQKLEPENQTALDVSKLLESSLKKD